MDAMSVVQSHSQDYRTSRRKFSCLLIGLFVVAPRIAIAQGSAVVRRIGLLEPGSVDTPEAMRERMAPLRELGWVEGQNLRVERRYANGRLEALQPLAEELVRAKVEVIVANGPNPTLAAMRATTTIPIVFRVASDPVLSGLVASLARPGGNVTGFSTAAPEVGAKLLSLLKELLPTAQRIGMLETAGNPQFLLLRGQFEHSCRSLGLEPVFVEISNAGEIDNAIARLAQQRIQALVLRSDSFSGTHGFAIIGAALKRGLPTITVMTDFVREAGALASYSATLAERERRAAYYVDRILRGAKPADLPVEQPTQFKLVINLKTARTLGLSVPQALLLRADEVIK
jgi:putative ABC transport system substrate-binding protein